MQQVRAATRRRRRTALWCWLFLLPQTLVFLAFVLWPTIASWYFALFDWDGFSWPTAYVGLDNFAEVASDPVFWSAFKNSMFYTTALVVIVVPMSLLVAIALNNPKLRGRNFFRVMFLLPVVLTAPIVGLEMRLLFATDNGLVNGLLTAIGLPRVDFLNNGTTAMAVLIFVGAWKTFGVQVVYWLAGLQTLPAELMDAAKVDGASRFQRLRFVIVPLMLPFLVVITFLQTLQGLRVFDLAKTLTNGGPYFATDMVPLYIYRYAFEPSTVAGTFALPRLGFASAAGIFYGVATFVIAIVLGALVRRSSRITGGER